VTFGSGWLRESIAEHFEDAVQRFPVLLPRSLDDDPARFAHLRLHNGTIWNWNRPLIGFDPDGTPHVRIEQRVLPAGPSVLDMIANAAFCGRPGQRAGDARAAAGGRSPVRTRARRLRGRGAHGTRGARRVARRAHAARPPARAR
jgi:hypothetical protein